LDGLSIDDLGAGLINRFLLGDGPFVENFSGVGRVVAHGVVWCDPVLGGIVVGCISAVPCL
jgi:hypothetical protein